MDERLQKVLTRWRDWSLPAKPVLLKRFADGENHETFLLAAAGQKFVLKVFRSPQPRAIQVQHWAARQRLAPAIICADSNSQLLLMDFCEGTRRAEPAALASGLARLHTRPVAGIAAVAGRFNLLNYYRMYLDKAGSQANQLHAVLTPAFEQFLSDKTPHCLCHNDLVQENCLVSDGSSRFIDWEYAQINNPWFDLASVIYYFRLEAAQTTEFLEYYSRDTQTQLNTGLLPAALCSMLWIDILWRLTRSGAQGWVAQQSRLADLKSFAGQLRIYF